MINKWDSRVRPLRPDQKFELIKRERAQSICCAQTALKSLVDDYAKAYDDNSLDAWAAAVNAVVEFLRYREHRAEVGEVSAQDNAGAK